MSPLWLNAPQRSYFQTCSVLVFSTLGASATRGPFRGKCKDCVSKYVADSLLFTF